MAAHVQIVGGPEHEGRPLPARHLERLAGRDPEAARVVDLGVGGREGAQRARQARVEEPQHRNPAARRMAAQQPHALDGEVGRLPEIAGHDRHLEAAPREPARQQRLLDLGSARELDRPAAEQRIDVGRVEAHPPARAHPRATCSNRRW